MTTSKENEGKKQLKLKRPGRLELNKTVESGQVRQSFSHGRSKQVTVEVKRKRTYAQGEGGRMTEVKSTQEEAERAFGPRGAAAADAEVMEAERPRQLTESERQARLRALETARRDEEHRRKAEAEAEALREAEREAEKERAAEAEERRRKEAEAAEQLRREEEERRKAKEPDEQAKPSEAAAEAETPAEPAPTPEGEAPAAPKPPARGRDYETELQDELGGRVKKKGAGKAAAKKPTPERDRRRGKLTISQALESEGAEGRRARSLAAMRRQREKQKQQHAHEPPSKVVREVVIPESITVQELANRMAERGAEVVKALMKMGTMATINQSLDTDTAELLVTEFGHKAKRVSDADVEVGLRGEEDRAEDLQPRAPVVTVMGHVDHGKTSLLDALRKTDVVAGEAGGITQHIGAYQVELSGGDRITFIDTPGHEAFTEMRSRGANVTDIVVLVVAADDGIKAQTVEAINHAKAAGVPIIVAINKCDKPEADPDRVRQELLNHELVVEEMGGDVLAIEVSAKAHQGLERLEESILLVAEMLELKANPYRAAEGVVVEAKLEKGRGPVATVLVRRGTLRTGDIFVVGTEWGRVRALVNDRGGQIKEAGPGVPVEVLGLQGMPKAGDEFIVVDNENRAREIAEFRQEQKRDKEAVAAGRGSLEQMLSRIKEGETKELPVVVKADVQGSVEAIVNAFDKLGNEEVAVRVLHAGVGGINESDVTLAHASDAMIIGFNVRANPQAREAARRDGVNIRYYSVIYNVVDDVKAALEGMLAPGERENILGYAEIRQVFQITKVGKVAGCRVTEGIVRRGAKVRLLRDDVVVHEGTLKSLKRFKDEVKEVREGYECGMAFENYNDIQEGDRIECYEIEEVAREL